MNHKNFPYRVKVYFNKVRTPKKAYPFKTLRMARKFLNGVSKQPLFVAGQIYRVAADGSEVHVDFKESEDCPMQIRVKRERVAGGTTYRLNYVYTGGQPSTRQLNTMSNIMRDEQLTEASFYTVGKDIRRA